MAQWASNLNRQFGRYNGYVASERAQTVLAERLKAQRDRSLEPFAQTLRAATGPEIFLQTKRVVDALPRDVMADLPVAFNQMHAREFRAWTDRSAARPPVASSSSSAGSASPGSGSGRDLLGGMGSGGSRPSAPQGAMRPQPQSAPAIPAAPSPHREALERATSSNAPSPMPAGSLVFFGGVVSDLVERCQVARGSAERAELFKLALAAQNRAAFGTGYANKDLGQTLQGNATEAGVFAAGVEFARLLDCGAAAEALAQSIAAASRLQTQGPGGGPSNFVQSCAATFSQEQCECVTKFGRSIYPDINQMTYNRSIIGGIVNSSPIVALQMAIACRISNY